MKSPSPEQLSLALTFRDMLKNAHFWCAVAGWTVFQHVLKAANFT